MKCIYCDSEKVRVVDAWGTISPGVSMSAEKCRCEDCGREWQRMVELRDTRRSKPARSTSGRRARF